ncbi:Uncharacterised protein [Achromobacter sp. 2789STDY5608615]|nr:Uncharacterised protein [Achromobacter sp. 2789STDY5608615]
MLQQLAIDTIFTIIGINEERLHMCPIDQREAMGIVIFIDCDSHWSMGQKATHFGVNGLSIPGAEKVMGGIQGASPKVNESGAVSRT